MAKNVIGEVIGRGIAGALTIGGVTVYVTQDDIADKYKENTGKELVMDKDDLVSFERAAKDDREYKSELLKTYNEIDCQKYEYDYVASCSDTKTAMRKYIDSLDAVIECDDRIVKNDDLQAIDLNFCINAEKAFRDAEEQMWIKIDGYCNTDCQDDIDISEYNIAMFQTYLEKSK